MTSLPVLLPDGFSATISTGETVTVGQTIAKKVSSEEEIINIAALLSLPVSKAKHVLLKNPGDSVSVGDVLAAKKGFLGLSKTTLRSRVHGTIVRYERDSAELVIRTSYSTLTQELFSPVDGTVTVCDNKKIAIDTDKHSLPMKAAVGDSAQGELFILEESFESEAKPVGSLLFQLTSEAIGKIIIGGKFTREVLAKGIGIGALGAVGLEISDEDLIYFSSKFPNVPVVAVEIETMSKLQEWKGKKVYLDSPSKSIIFLQI